MEFDRSFKSIDWSFVRQDLFFVLLVIKIAFMRFPYLSRYKHWFFIWLVVQTKTSTVTTSLKKNKSIYEFSLSLTLNWSSSTKYIILFKLVVRYIVLTHIVIFMLIFCLLLVKNLQIISKTEEKKIHQRVFVSFRLYNNLHIIIIIRNKWRNTEHYCRWIVMKRKKGHQGETTDWSEKLMSEYNNKTRRRDK